METVQLFHDRKAAGSQLASRLLSYKNDDNSLILALPRGGLPVAAEIANQLHLPLDALLVRKLGVPGNKEFAMGAIAIGDITFLDAATVAGLNISASEIEAVKQSELKELERRNAYYRQGRPAPVVSGTNIILVDDGIATGSTVKAALSAIRQQSPQTIILAVPVAPLSTIQALSTMVDHIVCLKTPEPFYSVGAWYEHFPQVSDEEALALLKQQ